MSDYLENKILNCKKFSAKFTDHDLVQLTVKLQDYKTEKGTGYWKFNTSLLRDQNFVQNTKKIIEQTHNENKNLKDKGLSWDLIKMNIRSYTIKYSAKLKRDRTVMENDLSKELDRLVNLENQEEPILENIRLIKKELERISKIKTQGAILRSRAKWTEEGEKNTAYFLNLEKHYSENKIISQLKISETETITDQGKIMAEQQAFYKKLYSVPKVTQADILNSEPLFLQDNIPTLENKDNCEGVIRENECLKALKNSKNNKAPGSDGFPTDFYNFFWTDIKTYVIDSFNHAFDSGQLSIDQRRGIITLSPKKDKDRLLLKNWRPISLLNADYKLLAKTLSNRIKKVIPDLINHDQTGYIKGRYIGENIRTVSDIITYLKNTGNEGIILLIDFEKAFDTVSWDFIFKALARFGLGEDFIKWVKVLYNNVQSSIYNNGHLTKFFALERGVRQGCPLSVYLFLLIVELLAIKIRNTDSIKGIKVGNNTIKISQMADDTTLFIKNTDSIEPLKQILKSFASCSGLLANMEKTKAFQINRQTPLNKYDLNWPKENIKLLGITITDDMKEHYEENFMPKIRCMHSLLRIWLQRKLSLKGKIVVINSLIMSLFVFPISITYVPKNVLDEIDKAVFSFLWDNKPPKIAKNVIQNKITEGGLKMPNIYCKAEAWRVMWIKKAILNPDKIWVKILDNILENISFLDLLRSNTEKELEKNKRLPIFFQEIFKTWQKIHITKAETALDIRKQMIWYNKDLTIEHKHFFWEDWYKKGVVEIGDILDNENNFLSANQLNERYNLNCNFLKSLQIRQALPYSWRNILKENGANREIEEHRTYWVKYKNFEKDICQVKSVHCYWSLMKEITRPPSAVAKWNKFFTEHILNWNKIYSNPFQTATETTLQSFQYKLLHRIIACNHWLHIIGIEKDQNCRTCKVDDTLVHFFVQCKPATIFWQNFADWYSRLIGVNTEINYKDILLGKLGNTNTEKTLNYCILLAKYYIYKEKMSEAKQDITLFGFLKMLKSKLNEMYVYSKQENNIENFLTKWNYIFENV